MGIKSIIACCLALLIGGSIAVADDATPTTIDGIATFTTGGVNLRQGPSPHSPYLCYLQGEEMYFEPENVIWSTELGATRVNGEIILTPHDKLQGEEGLTLPVLGTDGDWVKLKYLGHDVWTMKKFLNITKPATLTTATTAGYDYNKFNLTGDADGSPAILYQEAGMDEDEGLWIGKKQGNSVIFDRFLPVMMRYDEKAKDLQVSKDPEGGYLVFTFGPDQRLASFTDWNVIDVKGFSAQNINDLLPLASQGNPVLFLSTGTDYILIPQ